MSKLNKVISDKDEQETKIINQFLDILKTIRAELALSNVMYAKKNDLDYLRIKEDI